MQRTELPLHWRSRSRPIYRGSSRCATPMPGLRLYRAASSYRQVEVLIALIKGRLAAKDLDSLEVMTSGGVGYELTIPLSVYETLPRIGEEVKLHTSLVV